MASRSSLDAFAMSQRCQNRKWPSSFNNFVSSVEQGEGHGDAERLRSFQIDDQFHRSRLLHRQIGRLVALENSPRIDAGPSIRFLDAATIAHHAAGLANSLYS